MKKRVFVVCVIMILVLIGTMGCSLSASKSLPSDPENVNSAVVSPSHDPGDGDDTPTTDPQGFEFVPTVDLSDKTYIAYGDSITWGYASREPDYRMEKPYPTLVSELLGLASCTNSGVSGATLTANSFGLFNETSLICSVRSSSDIISVMMGVNDYNRSLPLGTPSDTDNTTFYGSLSMVMEHFHTYYPDSFVFFMTPFNLYLSGHDGYKNNSQGYNLGDVSNAIKNMANKYGFAVLDLLAEGRFEEEMYSSGSDGIHPSQEFFQNYTAPQIAQFVNDHFDSDRKQ